MADYLSYMNPIVPKAALEWLAVVIGGSGYPSYLYVKSINPTQAASMKSGDSSLLGFGLTLLLAGISIYYKNRAWTYLFGLAFLSSILIATVG